MGPSGSQITRGAGELSRPSLACRSDHGVLSCGLDIHVYSSVGHCIDMAYLLDRRI